MVGHAIKSHATKEQALRVCLKYSTQV